MKTEDNLAELRQWVTESFSVIEDKNLGFQNFSKQPKVDVPPEAQVVGTLPFQGNQDQLICMNTIQDCNILNMTFEVEYDYFRLYKQSLEHLTQLIGHEGPGSLFQCLKTLNFVSSLGTELSSSHITLFCQVVLTIELTEEGLSSYKQVLSVISEYFRQCSEHWLVNEVPTVFKETQTVNKLSFDLYKVPDHLDNACDLATALIFTHDCTKVVKDSYSPELYETIDRADIIEYARGLKYENAKVVICGSNLLAREDVPDQPALTEILKDQYFKTSYRLH